jgi:hypothetical protein
MLIAIVATLALAILVNLSFLARSALATKATSARTSFPMAVYLWENEILDVLPGLGPPKYEPIKAIAFHTRSTSKFYGDDYAVD